MSLVSNRLFKKITITTSNQSLIHWIIQQYFILMSIFQPTRFLTLSKIIYLHWKFLLWTCVFCKLNIPSFVPKICRTIFGENIRCITFRYFCTKIFFELVNIFGTGCGTICCVVVWCHYCVAGPGLIWLVSRKFYLVTWRHCGQESAVQCGPQYKIFYFLISVRGPGSQIALPLSLWKCCLIESVSSCAAQARLPGCGGHQSCGKSGPGPHTFTLNFYTASQTNCLCIT